MHRTAGHSGMLHPRDTVSHFSNPNTRYKLKTKAFRRVKEINCDVSHDGRRARPGFYQSMVKERN